MAPEMAPAPPGSAGLKLILQDFPVGTSAEHLRDVFGAYGTVSSVQLLSGNRAVMEMDDVSEGQWLVDNVDGNIPQGFTKPVSVQPLVEPPQPPPLLPAAATTGHSGAQPRAKREESAPSDNLYIRGLPENTTEESVLKIFGVYGAVISCKVLKSPPGKPDVAALLRMGSQDEAKWMIETLNSNIPHGLSDPVIIKYADNSKGYMFSRGSGDGTRFGAGEIQPSSNLYMKLPGRGEIQPSSNLYMKGLPNEIDAEQLKTIFGTFGAVASVKVLPMPQGICQPNSAAALVNMSSVEEAQWLVGHVNNNIPNGLLSPVQIRFSAHSKGLGRGTGTGEAGPLWPGSGPLESVSPALACGGAVLPSPLGGFCCPAVGSRGSPVSAPKMAIQPGPPSNNLYMRGFPGDLDEPTLRAILTPYGGVASLRVFPPPPGKQTSAALVRMSLLEEAVWLVNNMDGNIPQGLHTPIEVKFSANGGKSTNGKGNGVGPQKWVLPAQPY